MQSVVDDVVEVVNEVVDVVNEVVDEVPLGVPECVVGQNPPASSEATRGAGRLPGLLVDPGPSVNGLEVRHTPWLGEVLGVPPDLYLIREV
jgi:hypothetical protein